MQAVDNIIQLKCTLQKLLPLKCDVPLHQPEVCLHQIQEQSSVEPPWLLPVPAQTADVLVRGLAPAAPPRGYYYCRYVCSVYTVKTSDALHGLTKAALTLAEELLAQLLVQMQLVAH